MRRPTVCAAGSNSSSFAEPLGDGDRPLGGAVVVGEGVGDVRARLNPHGTGLHDKGLPVRPVHRVTGAMWLAAARTLERMAPLGERAGVTFCLENLNAAVDHPGVPFARAADTLALVEALDRPGSASHASSAARAQVQHQRLRMRLRRGLRCILAEPKVSQVVAAAASHSYVGERRRGGEADDYRTTPPRRAVEATARTATENRLVAGLLSSAVPRSRRKRHESNRLHPSVRRMGISLRRPLCPGCR